MKQPISLSLLLCLASSPASGDVYRYLAEDGTECFTDAPVSSGASLYMRDRKKSSATSTAGRTGTRRKTPNHLAATGIASLPTTDTTSSSQQYILPVNGHVTSLVGTRIDPIDKVPRHHNGVDISVPEGTAVKPVAEGQVIYSGPRGGYGNMVIVDHGGGLITLYAHNSRNTCSVGDRVTKESLVAYSGSTGRSTGPHLHFEAWQDDTNITPRYTGQPIPAATAARHVRIRTVVQADGTVLLTNLPPHP